LLIVHQIGYEETGRQKEIDKTILYISSAVHRVQLTADFPKEIAVQQLDNVHSAALGLFIAIMEYLALAILHLQARHSGQQCPAFKGFY
jgi:hypothetical protein